MHLVSLCAIAFAVGATAFAFVALRKAARAQAEAAHYMREASTFLPAALAGIYSRVGRAQIALAAGKTRDAREQLEEAVEFGHAQVDVMKKRGLWAG